MAEVGRLEPWGSFWVLSMVMSAHPVRDSAVYLICHLWTHMGFPTHNPNRPIPIPIPTTLSRNPKPHKQQHTFSAPRASMEVLRPIDRSAESKNDSEVIVMSTSSDFQYEAQTQEAIGMWFFMNNLKYSCVFVHCVCVPFVRSTTNFLQLSTAGAYMATRLVPCRADNNLVAKMRHSSQNAMTWVVVNLRYSSFFSVICVTPLTR